MFRANSLKTSQNQNLRSRSTAYVKRPTRAAVKNADTAGPRLALTAAAREARHPGNPVTDLYWTFECAVAFTAACAQAWGVRMALHTRVPLGEFAGDPDTGRAAFVAASTLQSVVRRLHGNLAPDPAFSRSAGCAAARAMRVLPARPPCMTPAVRDLA